MSDEEKKAFESVKDMFSDVTIKDIDEQSITLYGIAMLDVIKVLTIVEKQSKEIERLNNKFEKIYNEIDNKNSQLVKALNYKLFIEDKIKAKIEEYKKQIEKMEKDDIGIGFTLGKEWSDLKAKIEFGQSLLEKG